jgi:hypothetical protein
LGSLYNKETTCTIYPHKGGCICIGGAVDRSSKTVTRWNPAQFVKSLDAVNLFALNYKLNGPYAMIPHAINPLK